MKIRAVTIGIRLTSDDLENLEALKLKLIAALDKVKAIKLKLENDGQIVQTLRISLNSFEQWLLPAVAKSGRPLVDVVKELDAVIASTGVDFCSFGYASTAEGLAHVTDILANANVSISAALGKAGDVSVDRALSIQAAKIAFDLAKRCGDLANFRYCASFNCPPNIPFFPVSYHEGPETIATIALENGDLISLGCRTAKNHTDARNNLTNILVEKLTPIEKVATAACEELGITYGGIDATFNPGLPMADSIGKGLEELLPEGFKFGQPGTLAAVTTLTTAIKALAAEKKIKTVGYCGLMLPVMEDLVLAARASEQPPAFALRDVLFFSSVCGCGIDTVPVPADSDPAHLAAVYEDVAAMAYRLQKPLACRVLPMNGLQVGDMTDVVNPYLCNARVFSLL